MGATGAQLDFARARSGSLRECARTQLMKSLPQTPSFRLDGRRALVTGAGRGIGEAAAHVTLAARTGDELDVLCGSLRAQGLSADTMVLDVPDVEQACQKIRSSEPFDILVNNAGTNRPMPMVAVRSTILTPSSVSTCGRHSSSYRRSPKGSWRQTAPARSSTCRPRWGTSGRRAGRSTVQANGL